MLRFKSRTILYAGLLALSLSVLTGAACGRRNAAAPSDDTGESHTTGSAQPTDTSPSVAGDPATAELLDSIDFGRQDSEKAHEFKGQDTVKPLAGGKPRNKSDVRITALTASSGGAPEMTLYEPGQWAVGSKGEWIQYELNKPTSLEKVEIAWAAARNNYFFTVKTRTEGEEWEKAYSGRCHGDKETYEFSPVKAKKVRIVAGGARRWWRPGVFRMKQIWLGDLPYPEAYQVRSAYEPALGTACRRLRSDKDEDGASMSFTMDTKPDEQNYFTVKFWGSDRRMVNLRLSDGDGNYIDGAAPAWKPLGGYGAHGMAQFWEFGGSAAAGAFPGRFIYATYPVPHAFTKGKDEVRFQLSAPGKTAHPSQGIYAAYTHSGKFFGPPADEKQGEPMRWDETRPNKLTHQERLKMLKDRARKLINRVFERRPKPGSQRGARRLQSLTDAYHAEWSDHYHDEEIVHIVTEALDAAVQRQAREGVEGHMGGHKWHYQGIMAHCMTGIWDAFQESGVLEETIDHDGNEDTDPVTRRKAYARYFKKGFEWRKSEAGARREVSNQTMAVSRGLYRMQVALRKLNPDMALPEEQANRYVLESLGMKPFYLPYPRRDWVRDAADAGFPFTIITADGLALEGGHASGYGELAPHRGTRLAEELGTPEALERAKQLVKARAIASRRPALDGAGYAALRSEETFTYRGRSYPAPIRYGPITQAAILGDPVSLRLAELYMKHGHFTEDTRQGRVVRRVEDYKKVVNMLEEKQSQPLPFEPDHEDFAWGDEGAGVFAIKHGDTMIHGCFVLSMPGAVVPVARVHYTTPRIDRLADVKTQIEVPEPDGHISPASDGDSILADMKFPKTPPPPKLEHVEQWRQQDIRASMAYFYTLRFGNYLVGMNTTQEGTYRENTYELQVPDDVDADEALNLVSGETVDLSKPIKVGPHSTVVLYLGD